MMDDHNELLKESIKASDRTTHAVRAFVRFFLIQLTASSAALAIYLFASANPSDSSTFLIFIAAITWVIGVVVSSVAGWSELSLSKIPYLSVSSNAGNTLATDIPKPSGLADDAKLNLLSRAQHGLWLDAEKPSLSNWDGQSDFAQWLVSRK